MENKALVVIDLQNDITKNYKLIIDKVNSAVDWASEKKMHIIYVKHYNLAGADATGCVKSSSYNLSKNGYKVHVISDCVTSYDLKLLPDMYKYYVNKGCEVLTLAEC